MDFVGGIRIVLIYTGITIIKVDLVIEPIRNHDIVGVDNHLLFIRFESALLSHFVLNIVDNVRFHHIVRINVNLVIDDPIDPNHVTIHHFLRIRLFVKLLVLIT